jgi:hypothetical protein
MDVAALSTKSHFSWNRQIYALAHTAHNIEIPTWPRKFSKHLSIFAS